MEVIFMGTGTSQGVPMIAHDAPHLDLSNPRNWRTRTAIHVEMGGVHIQVDAGGEFRMQCLQNEIMQVDYFILTHGHADHIMGMDDLRRFCTLNGSSAMPVYSNPAGLQRVREVFPYAIRDTPVNRFYPAFKLHEVEPLLKTEGGDIYTVQLPHGSIETVGLVFVEHATGAKFTYFTDCKSVPETARALARGSDVIVLDALQPIAHATHMNIEEALEVAKDLAAPQTYFTHASFLVDHETENAKLPDMIEYAYDGLRLKW